MGLQNSESPNLGNFGNLGVPRQNDIWVLVLWPGTNNTIKGKVVASPKFRLWWVLWVLWVCACMWLVFAPKLPSYALTNLLFGLWRSVWVIDLLVTLPSPYFGALVHPSTPEVLQAREHTPTFHSSIVFTLDSHFSLLRSLGLRHATFSYSMIIIEFVKATPLPLLTKLDQLDKSLKRKEYEANITFKDIWVVMLPWAKFVVGSDNKIS